MNKSTRRTGLLFHMREEGNDVVLGDRLDLQDTRGVQGRRLANSGGGGKSSHEKALEANPNDVASRMGLAQALMQGEKWMDAAEHLDKVVNDDAVEDMVNKRFDKWTEMWRLHAQHQRCRRDSGRLQ